MLENLFDYKEKETEEHWVSISDVMAGLMVIFLFISISYIIIANNKTESANNKTESISKLRNQIKNRLGAYTNLQEDLSDDLRSEFEGTDIKIKEFKNIWNGELYPESLSIRFKKPFSQGDATVPSAFKYVLRNFFPRYIAILTKPEYRDEIAEIRIEGHTSSEWFDRVGKDEAYYNNMELSQDRSRNVLQYVLEIRHPTIIHNKEWIKEHLTANGLSSSKLIIDPGGYQNREESRRVEFRVVTKSEKLIDAIQKLLQEFDDIEVSK